MIEKCAIKHHSFIKWSGAPIANTYGGKAVLDYKEQPLFAELVALNLYKEQGFEGVWVDTYSKKYRIGLPENTAPLQLPAEIDAALQQILVINESSKGVWDLLLWKADKLKFVELKRLDEIYTAQCLWKIIYLPALWSNSKTRLVAS